MRVTALLLASVLCVCGPAFARDWELYTNNEDGFKLDFPGAPKMTCPKDYPDERSCGLTNAGRGYWKEDMAGAVLWATYGFLQRNAKLTHLAYAWQDLVQGHEI